jgi:pyridoxamine 5'-phosphate oxidase
MFYKTCHMDKSKKLHELRKNYTMGVLHVDEMLPDAIEQFTRWFEQALFAELPEPNAMTLATASASGRVSSRVVLLKEFDERGFVFYTNYNSRKAFDLAENPYAAASFLWLELERQVRIEGNVEQISEEESDEYFQNRPRDSQIGAWSSDQSKEVASRNELAELYARREKEFEGRNVPRPPYWGGYRIIPETIEFWQGGPGRIHDRILYTRVAALWTRKRLAP